MADIARIRAEYRKSLEDSMQELRGHIAEAESFGLRPTSFRRALQRLGGLLTRIDPGDPKTWSVAPLTADLSRASEELVRQWRSSETNADNAREAGLQAERARDLLGIVSAWRAFQHHVGRCDSLAARILPRARAPAGGASAGTATPPDRPIRGKVNEVDASTEQIAEQLEALRQRLRESDLDGPARADAIDAWSSSNDSLGAARHSLSVARQLLGSDAEEADEFISGFLQDARDALEMALEGISEVEVLLDFSEQTPEPPPVPKTPGAELELPPAQPGAQPTWPSDALWGEPTPAQRPELDRPVFGIEARNRTWRARWGRQQYIWTDARGRQWTRYRRYRDGETVTLHVRITALDVPKSVMGITGMLILSAGAEAADMTFPVRTVPLLAGESRWEKIPVHVPQAIIDREGGNWLRKMKLTDVARLLRIRLGAVRFQDGLQAVYFSEATVEAGDTPLGPAVPSAIYGPPPEQAGKANGQGATLKVGGKPLGAVEVVPYNHGRVWVKSQVTKEGVWIPGHWRMRPKK